MTATAFVEMYHPLLDNLIVDVPVQAADDYAARGWLLVDPDAIPVVVHPYLTQAAGDSRYVRDLELDAQAAALVADSASALSAAQRAAFVPKWKPSTAYASGEYVLNPSGQIVSANTAFTSGASYSASNWTVAPRTISTVTGLQAALDAKAPLLVTQTSQTGTTYTLALADAGTIVELSNAAAITLTVPLNSAVAFPVGTTLALRQTGAGQITVSPAGGVNVRSRGSALKLSGQYAEASLTKRATDEWVLTGDVTA